jgi:hypothetical protein
MARPKGRAGLHGDAAASMLDIAEALGITKGGAWMLLQFATAADAAKRVQHAVELAQSLSGCSQSAESHRFALPEADEPRICLRSAGVRLQSVLASSEWLSFFFKSIGLAIPIEIADTCNAPGSAHNAFAAIAFEWQ